LQEPEPLDSFVVVRKDDVLEAIGAFVAAYLATLPEAQDLKPKELQAALAMALQVAAPVRACVHRGLVFLWPLLSLLWDGRVRRTSKNGPGW
jgi:hypothetical protein